MDLNDIIERAKSILLSPKETWESLREAPGSPAELYKNYLIYLAVIPAIAIFIGQSIVGSFSGFESQFVRVPIGKGLLAMVLRYVLYLIGVYIAGVLVAMVAPRFEGEKNIPAAVRLVGYSATPGWIVSALYIIPRLGDLSVFGYLYGVYLFVLGLPIMMKNPPEKNLSFAIVSLALVVVVIIVVALLMSGYIH